VSLTGTGDRPLRRGLARGLELALPGALLLAVIGTLASGSPASDGVRLQQRNFFGILRVVETYPEDPARHRLNLRHGTTIHGLQFQKPEARGLPTAYFGRMTGIGLLFDHTSGRERREVGVVGLGVGTLASYGRPADRFTFYEIDPDVVRIAHDPRFFTYLRDSAAEIRVVPGDARLSLEADPPVEGAPGYDLLVLDAFSSDAIPVHLLTLEAFRLYLRHLAPGGLIAAHVSNQYLELAPLILRAGDELGLSGVRIANRAHDDSLSMASVWIVLAREPAAIGALKRRVLLRRQALGLDAADLFVDRPDADPADTPLWTDDYSDLFGAIVVD
jgi:hypothetical protein